MTHQQERALLFKNLHIKGNPLVIFNVWDAGTSKVAEEMGCKAVGTSSRSVAAAHGYEDGENLPLDLVLGNLERIVKSVHLPVTLDFEGGYGHSPEQIQKTVTKVVTAGTIGLNLEDQIMGSDTLYSLKEQCVRINAARLCTSFPLFINARTDIFLKIAPENHDESHVEEALLRSKAYAESGADGFFVPGLQNEKFIEKLCDLSPLPINIMVSPHGLTPQNLAQIGVSRLSYGPFPYYHVMNSFKDMGRKALNIFAK